MSVITDCDQHSQRHGALLTDPSLQSSSALISPSQALPMGLLTTDPAKLLTSDTVVPVPAAFRPLLICLSSLRAIRVPRSAANNYGNTAPSVAEEGYASIQERDTRELQVFTAQQPELCANFVEPEALFMDMDRTEQLCSALLVVKLAVTCSEAITAASSTNATAHLAHEAIWMIVSSLSQSMCLNIASRKLSTADQERHLCLLVIGLLMSRLRKAVRSDAADASVQDVVPNICWMLCGALTALKSVASAIAHEIVKTGMHVRFCCACIVCSLISFLDVRFAATSVTGCCV